MKRKGTPSDIQDHLWELYTWGRGWPNPHGARILEIGVRTGNSTSAFLAALEVDRKGCLWSIDIAEPEVPPEWIDSGRWMFHQQDSLHPDAQAWVPPEIDVLFLDGDHEYARVFGELMTYGPRVVPGGVILCHDTEYMTGPSKSIKGPEPGLHHESAVGRALDTYASFRKLQWVNRPGCYGLGVLRIPPG